MKKIVAYNLEYTRGGGGRINFLLEGEATARTTGYISIADFTALTSLLLHPGAAFNPAANIFAAHSQGPPFVPVIA